MSELNKSFHDRTSLSIVYLNSRLGWFLDILNIISLSKSLKGLRDLLVAIV